MTPLRPQTARLRAAAVGPPVRVLLADDSADLLVPVAAAEALGLGGRRGSFRVRLVLPAGLRVVSLSWIERSADGLRFLQATGAQRRLRSDLSLPDGPHEVALAPELGTATNLHVSLASASPPAEPADALEAAGMTSAPADGGSAAPSVDTAATLTVTGAPQLSGRKRPRDGLPAVSDARSPPGADAGPQAATVDEGQAVAAERGSTASPAQQTARITARQSSDGDSLFVSKLEARGVGLRGKYRDRVVDVPELRRKYTLRIGWGADRYRVGKGWRELAEVMRLPVDAKVVLTVTDGTICSLERAPAAAAASNSSSTPRASTANGGLVVAAQAGGIAAPAQQIFRITARQKSDGRSLYVPTQAARAAGLSGEYCDRVVNVPELRRKVTLRVGWGAKECQVGRGWRELAKDMHLSVNAHVVLTVVDGTICSVERAPAAAAASNSSGTPRASTADGGLAPAAEAGGNVSPAQQTVQITARQRSNGDSLSIPLQEAHAADLRGELRDRVIYVPELRREVTLRAGWGCDRFRVSSGWRELAADMRLPADASVVLAVADGTICSVERAPAAAAASNSSGTPGASTANGSLALAAEAGGIALPAQQASQITARQGSNGDSLLIPLQEAQAADLRGEICDREVDVPELQRKVTLRVGWGADRFRIGGKRWRELAAEMRLPAGASVVLTVADGTICSVERAPAAAAASNSSGTPGASTANGGLALVAEAGGIAPPAQQTVRITARQHSEGRSLAVPKEEALAAGLSGKYCDRMVAVPELRREVRLRIGWAEGRFRVGQGWRELAADMHLPLDARVVLTVADGTICSLERAPAAAVASDSSGMPGASTASGGRALAAEGGGIAAPAQQIVRITARQKRNGWSLYFPQQEARAAGLSGKYCDRVVDVPELRRKVTLRLGWGAKECFVGRGWRELAADMRLPVDARVVLTVADGTICSVERAHAAAAAGTSSSMPRANSGTICTTSALPSAPAASAQPGHEAAADGDDDLTPAGGQSSRLYPPTASSVRHCRVS